MSPKPLLDIGDAEWTIVEAILQRHVPGREVWAFGSRARWTAKEFSDLDLFIQGEQPLAGEDAAALAEAFAESDLPWKVDVVDGATVSAAFREVIERDKVVVQWTVCKNANVDEGGFKWRDCTLGEFVRLQRGHDLTASEQQSGNIPIMGSAGPNGTHNKALASGPGVAIGRSGASAGRVHFSEVDYWPHNTCLYVTDFLGANPRFAYYLLQTLDLAAFNSGSAQASLNRNFLYSIPLKVPQRSEQNSIVEVLQAFDDRIALLRETNATLEAMAQALFKSWFVDFDPVRAKMEGRVPEGMDEATAALFPDEFEETGLGKIPKGWHCTRLDQFLELAYGKALKAGDRVVGEVPVYGSGGETGWHNECLVQGPSVIIGRKGTVGSLYWEDRPFFPIDTVFYIRTSIPMTYCFYLLQTLGLSEMNTDAAVPGLNRGNVYRLTVPFADTAVLEAFDNIVGSIRKRMFNNNQQIQLLSTLRDTLLPRLISGQLRLPEAMKEVAAA